METRLTQYSHGAGCGCKIAPAVLNTILQSQLTLNHDPKLLVGHDSRDDAAVYDLGNGHAVISTTDFFMPIVDDAFDFGRIAVNNAISDIYAMGGTPLMAIAILGWPIEQLPPQLAGRVVDGGRQACQEAGIQLAGGHSIDAPEPIFGAAVTGTVQHEHLKRNDTAEPGCQLFLTKPLGIGLLTTAEKKGLLHERHRGLARDLMCRLNDAGRHFAQLPGVRAMTDVTGFGLLGHLLEMCQGSRVRAHLEGASIPRIDGVEHYIQQGCIPGGTQRNFESIRAHIGPLSAHNQALLCDPQTSGGLLVAVTAAGQSAFTECARQLGLDLHAIGHLTEVQGATLIECHG